MKDLTNVSSLELLIGTIVIIALILGAIFFGRWLLNHQSSTELSKLHKSDNWHKMLKWRTKYPEADAFKFSGILLKFSLAISVALIIGAFNWTSSTEQVEVADYEFSEIIDVEVTPPRSEVLPPPPPPPAPTLIEEVPPEMLLEEEEVEFLDQSIEAETQLEVEKPVIEEKVAPPPPPPPPPRKEEAEEIFKVVEEMPRFPGCEDVKGKDERKLCSETKFLEFVYANIKYPRMARENGVEGTVVVEFIVNQQGIIEGTSIARDIGAGCGDESVRVINKMNEMPNRWIPGKQRGKKVKVSYMVPIKFKLETTN